MTKDFGESLVLLKKLDCSDKYFYNDSMFWFKQDPGLVFQIRKNGTIIVKEIFTEKQISIYDLWEVFDNDQRKLIVYNLDKFIC